ncbi:hypothetical protein BDQ12DRAFT_670758 [Crucibulum laeve]|uniref:Uncharacterized protein n=1 Tax=Crucibulum laeve TaxID=68775 RepID=A0A5C3LJP7_9AGAR|nr:hypothetical protein BDQ12DRAFT_670758 [Crucibulum laeve]
MFPKSQHAASTTIPATPCTPKSTRSISVAASSTIDDIPLSTSFSTVTSNANSLNEQCLSITAPTGSTSGLFTGNNPTSVPTSSIRNYLMVMAAGYGLKAHSWKRTCQLKPAIPNNAKNHSMITSTFYAKSKHLVECAELLANQTGCWAFVALQHPHLQSHYLHYSSPLLISNATDDTCTAVINFNKIFMSLVAAGHLNVREAYSDLHPSKMELGTVKKELELAKREAKEVSKSHVEVAKELLCLKALIAGGSSNSQA